MGTGSPRLLLRPMVISLLVVSYSAVSAATDQCSNVTEDDDSGGSCTFKDGWCGWSNEDSDDQLQWTRGGSGTNSHVSITMDGVRRGGVATLISPLLCATRSQTRSFRFHYYVENTTRCRLSLYLVTGGTRAVQVWSSTRGHSYYQPVNDLGLKCPDQPFQIMFIGEKRSSRSCGRYYNGIGIQDIVYEYRNFRFFSTTGECPAAPPTTTTTTTSTTATTSTSATTTTTTITTMTISPTKSSTFGSSNSTEHGLDKQTGEEGLSSGAVAGVVVVVVILIVIIVVVIVCLIMRRRKKWTWRWKRSMPTVVKIRRSVTHRTHYMLGAQPNDMALPNLQRQPNPDVIPEPSAPPPPPPYPTDTTPLPEPSPPPPGLPHLLPHPAILAKKGQCRHKASSAAAAAEGGAGDDPCRDNAGEEAHAAVQYVNSGSAPQPRDREGQYNVLQNGDHRGDVIPLPHARVPPGGNPYDHLNAGDGDYTHLGERTENRQDVEHYSTARRYSPECVTAPRAQRDGVGDRSRDDDDVDYANKCEYANDYANRSKEDEYSVAQPLSGDATYYNSQEKQTVDPVTDCEYSLAQHVRDQEVHDEEAREEESGDYHTSESMAPQQQKTPDKNTQYSLAQNVQHTGRKPAVVPKPKPKPDNAYSLTKTTDPQLSADVTRKNHVTNGDVSKAHAHIQRKHAGEVPTHENRPAGDYVNVQNASSKSAVGTSKTGDNYNRLDFTEHYGQESEPTVAEYYNTGPAGRGGYDHLQLPQTPPGNGTDEELYCNVDGGRNASPC